MGSIFTKIIKGEIPCHKILEDEYFFSFLEINPLATGHTLVIPKKEVDYVFDLDDTSLAGLILFSKKVSAKIKKAIPCKKVALMVYGLQVPHAHIHLVPVNGTAGELNFSNAKKASPDELARVAKLIKACL